MAHPLSIQLSADAGIGENYHTRYFKFPRPAICPDGYQWNICLKSMSIANTQLTVNEYCDTIEVDGVALKVTHGNYDAYTLSSALSLVTSKPFIYDSVTLKMRVSAANSFTLSGTLPLLLLNIPPGTSTSFESLSTISLQGVSSIFVSTDAVSASISCTQTALPTCLARVQNNVAPLQILHFSDPNPVGCLLHDNSLFGLTIYLNDELGRPLLATDGYEMTLILFPVFTGRYSLNTERPASLSFPPK